ncbi:uncharacterized protein LOC110938386 [Helianthus annuus]|uniref:uncharacterized protein LOC110938386 n=1 Tax=Helianthus annuus TaxID=4232 RepID=UPI0016530930|nr:uncharacterized protein LOC110938386 [Helianthus annuus]
MDEDGVALVLARASELHSKITNCIQNASSTPDDDAEEADSLLNIRESLEAQLSSLQVDLLLFVVHILELFENTIDYADEDSGPPRRRTEEDDGIDYLSVSECESSPDVERERKAAGGLWIFRRCKSSGIDEAYETNLRVVCIKQKLQTCQTFSDHEGLSQQSLVIQTPKYHKQNLLPVVRSPGMAELKISLAKPGLRSDGVSVWEWSGSALDEGDEAAKWFTDFLGKPSRLVRFNEESET